MKLLFDLFPVILFFATFKYTEKNPELASSWMGSLLGFVPDDIKLAPILLATVVVIAATVAQIIWVHFRHGKVDKMLWVSLVIITVFGGMTLFLHDETFIKWKPTVLYWAFAVALAGGALFMKKNFIRTMLGEQLELPEHIWTRLNWSWVGFFVFMGVANLAVAFAFNLSTDVWVNFKLFGGMGLMFVFAMAQVLMLSKYVEEKK